MSRAQALAIIRTQGDDTPRKDIERFCRFARITPKTFLETAERFRNPAVWQRRDDGVWHIPGFLIPDWRWT